jgi:hypothetical protein
MTFISLVFFSVEDIGSLDWDNACRTTIRLDIVCSATSHAEFRSRFDGSERHSDSHSNIETTSSSREGGGVNLGFLAEICFLDTTLIYFPLSIQNYSQSATVNLDPLNSARLTIHAIQLSTLV